MIGTKLVSDKESRASMKRKLLLLATIALLQALLAYFVFTQRFPNSGDDYSYLYQARLFATGHLVASRSTNPAGP